MPRAAASTFEVATAHEPCSASSVTWTALSGPMESALRIDSVAPAGPMVSTVTSPPCASLIFNASSMAYSSISLMTLFAEPRSTVLSLALRVRSAPESGTCFTSTTMFIAFLRPSCYEHPSKPPRPPPGSGLKATYLGRTAAAAAAAAWKVTRQ